MEQNISANMTGIAALPKFRLPMDLQLFAEETPAEVVVAPKDEIYTSAAEHAAVSVKEPVVAEQVAVKEVVEPIVKDAERDLEKDSAFAEMRRKAEAAETKSQQLEQEKQKTLEIARKYGHLGVFSDEEVSKKYGQSHGLFTLADVDRKLEEERIEQERTDYAAQGIDYDKINKIVDDKLESHPSVVQAKKQTFENLLMTNYNELQAEFKDIVTKPEDISPEVWAKWNEGKSGLSLTDAYYLENRKTLADKQQAASKQAALNALNSKNHMKTNEGSSEELDTGSIPDDVMTINRRMFAKELKAGTMTEKDIIKHYQRHNKT